MAKRQGGLGKFGRERADTNLEAQQHEGTAYEAALKSALPHPLFRKLAHTQGPVWAQTIEVWLNSESLVD